MFSKINRQFHNSSLIAILCAVGTLLSLRAFVTLPDQALAQNQPEEVSQVPMVTHISPLKDNTLYEDVAGSLSNGAGEHFFVGQTSTGNIRRGVIAFDVASMVIPNSTIISVTLILNVSMTPDPLSSHNIEIHRLLSDWGEGTSNAAGAEGAGAASTLGDATWLHRFFSTDLWSTAGGDFAPAVSAVTTVGGVGVYSWGSTPEMVADVQAWVDQPGTNFGWVLIGNEASTGTARRFDTKENAVAANQPLLRVVYMPAHQVYLPAAIND